MLVGSDDSDDPTSVVLELVLSSSPMKKGCGGTYESSSKFSINRPV
jgi:hypothetical protein